MGAAIRFLGKEQAKEVVARHVPLSGKAKEALAGYALLAPDLIGLTVIYALPILFTVFLSFHSWTGMNQLRYLGLQNYLSLFKDPIWRQSVRVTVTYLLLYVPAIMTGSLLLALLVNTRLRVCKKSTSRS
jgi:ABC-type sugar transport system permease subunit